MTKQLFYRLNLRLSFNVWGIGDFSKIYFDFKIIIHCYKRTYKIFLKTLNEVLIFCDEQMAPLTT